MALTASEELLAFLMAPGEVSRPDGEALPQPGQFLSAVQEGKLPLDEVLAVSGLEADPICNTEAVRAALESDRQRHRRAREEFLALRERLDEASVDHALIKAVHGVPYRSENIDILIPRDRIPVAEKMLVEMGYIRNRCYREPYKLLYNRISGRELTGMFHLHEKVGWYAPFIEGELVFATSRDGAEAGLRMPSAEIALAVTGCHAIHEEASVKLIELHKVRCLLNQGPVDWDLLWATARHRGYESGLALFFLMIDAQHRTYVGRPLFDEGQLGQMRRHLSRVDGTRPHFRRRVAGRQLHAPYMMSKYFARRCLLRVVKRSGLMGPGTKAWMTGHILKEGVKQVLHWHPQPPMLVAVCGADGSGKTTQVQNLAAHLRRFEIRVSRNWLRIGDSPVLNLLKRPFHRRVQAEAEVGQSSQQGVFSNRLIRRLWAIVAVTDYLIRQYLTIGWAYLRGRTVVADRYHVDALVDLAVRGGQEVFQNRWILWAMRLLPKARPAFVLEVPDETLRRRRSADYVASITDRQVGYYDIAARLMGARVVSGRQEIDAIAEQLAKEALHEFMRRL